MITRVEQIKKLQEKPWYRLLKIVAIIIVLFAFLAPFFQEYNCINSFYNETPCTFSEKIEKGVLLDSFINGGVILLLVYLARYGVLYVMFGGAKKPEQKKMDPELRKKIEEKERRANKTFIIVITSFLFLIIVIPVLFALLVGK